LLEAVGEVAFRAGVEAIIGNFDAPMLRLYRRIGREVEVLGSTLSIVDRFIWDYTQLPNRSFAG
jgi:N-acyl-L-homoserine lactone synthetase